jgi:hypothetical protein
MRATGLGFDELAQTIRGLGQDISTTTTSGINALEMIKNSQVGRQKTLADIANINADVKAKGLQLEENTIKVNELKRREAELNKPMSLSDVFGVITEGYDDSRKLTAVNKIPQIASLAGWTIDPDDQNKPILKNDGTAVTMRDVAKTGQLISAVYTHSANPLITTQDAALKTKAQLQKALPNVNLGPGVEIDESLLQNLHAQMKAGKLSNDLIPLVNEAIAAQNDYRYVGNHPREVWAMYVDKLNLAKGQIAKIGGDTNMVDEAIKNAQAEMDKLPVSSKAAKITGIEEGTMLNPKEIVTLGGHVAGYNQGIDTEKMRDATMIKTTGMTIAGHERAAASQSDKENKVAFINNYANQMNSAAERASKDAQAIAEKATMSGQQMSPVDVQTLTNQLTAEYQSKVAQNTYDILGKDRMTALQLVIPDTVDQSSAKTRADQAPVVKSIGSYALSLNETDPLRTQIGNQLLEVDRLRRTGDESASQELLTRLTAAVEKYKKAKGENKNRAITEGAKGLHESKTIHSMLFGKDGLFSPGMFIDKTK